MFPLSPGRLATRGVGSRVHPRPSATVMGVGTVDCPRTEIPCGSKAGVVLGGSITRLNTGNNTETTVNLALWRSSVTASGDFIDRFDVVIETSGDESGQGSFSFVIPPEYNHPTVSSFWFSIKNESSSDEDYTIHFDVAPLVV